MVKGPEGKLKDKAVEYAESFGVTCIRLSFGRGVYTGWPDVLFLIEGGMPLFIEFKAPGRKPTTKQARRISHLLEAGYNVKVCDNIKDTKQIINAAITLARFGHNVRLP